MKYNNCYILLEQFRHALRKTQYSFVRGFAECENPLDDVKRELKEEIGVTEDDYITEPQKIGHIAADSGLTTTQAHVYYTEIKKYNLNCKHEGIEKALEVSCTEFSKLIHSGEINDGYTLSAYALLNSSHPVNS